MSYPFHWAAATDVGKLRDNNEDRFAVDADLGLFIVLDGMGGHAAGEVAAETAARDLPAIAGEQIKSMTPRGARAVRRWLARVVVEVSRQIHFLGRTRIAQEGMGATLALVLLLEGRAYMANLGDSRVYRIRAGRLTQLSKDHSLVRELIEEGEISPDEAPYHEARGIVTQHVGMPEGGDPYVRSYALRPGDRFLLCSDGLSDQVRDETIREVLEAHEDLQEACDIFVGLSNAAGGIDNVTVMLVEWTGESSHA